MTARVAVLASGGGSNLQAILDYFATLGERAPGTVALVISDRAKAFALERARKAGVAAEHVPSSAPPGTLSGLLKLHRIDVIALAGYLRFVPNHVTNAFRGRIINVHPALLPAFGGPGMYGRHVHEAVLKTGVRETGATVHFVDEVYDRGAIIAQTRVRVEPGDTVDALAARVLAQEHQLYPRVLAALCAGSVQLEKDGTVKGTEQFAS